MPITKDPPRHRNVAPVAIPIVQRAWFLALALAIVAFGVYAPVLQHPFVNFDDQSYIVENGHVTHGLTWSTVRWALTSTEEANWHPLTWISHALDCQVFGLNAAGHHATNAILHAANAALLFLMLLVATGLRWRSFAVATLFALHPLNVESVAWVAERKHVLPAVDPCRLRTVRPETAHRAISGRRLVIRVGAGIQTDDCDPPLCAAAAGLLAFATRTIPGHVGTAPFATKFLELVVVGEGATPGNVSGE